MTPASIVIEIPSWLDEAVAAWTEPLDSAQAQMRLCVALSRLNVERGGGPFGAAVFDGARLVAAGVNRVLDSGLSIAHAEIVALLRAQLVAPELVQGKAPSYRLVTSSEPCCQCYGALVWSGVDELVCGANTRDVEAVGFDEGPKPTAWAEALNRRGIRVQEGVERALACEVLTLYAQAGGTIYGLRHPRIAGREAEKP